MVHEAATLRKEAPTIARALQQTWGPRIEEQTQRFDLNPEEPRPGDSEKPQAPGIRIRSNWPPSRL